MQAENGYGPYPNASAHNFEDSCVYSDCVDDSDCCDGWACNAAYNGAPESPYGAYYLRAGRRPRLLHCRKSAGGTRRVERVSISVMVTGPSTTALVRITTINLVLAVEAVRQTAERLGVGELCTRTARARQDEIEARVVDRVLGDRVPVQFYDQGTWDRPR